MKVGKCVCVMVWCSTTNRFDNFHELGWEKGMVTRDSLLQNVCMYVQTYVRISLRPDRHQHQHRTSRLSEPVFAGAVPRRHRCRSPARWMVRRRRRHPPDRLRNMLLLNTKLPENDHKKQSLLYYLEVYQCVRRLVEWRHVHHLGKSVETADHLIDLIFKR